MKEEAQIIGGKNAFDHIGKAMDVIPPDALAAAVMRHAERGKIPEGEHGNDVLLTARGERDAVEAGKIMRGGISRILHSPVPRCRQTADGLRRGGGSGSVPEEWLGLRCDIYVSNFEVAETTLSRLVSEKDFYDHFIKRMSECGDKIPYPGFSPPFSATVELMKGIIGSRRRGLCVGITHDWLVNVAVSYATGRIVSRADDSYANYLDALFIWKADSCWMYYHKGRIRKCPISFTSFIERQ
ncbi:MAG: histidine phosphatase family protein [Candidatus Dadabacteria bacterium]|nr:histidine phosphatase family protein [Candidatus Dadabacteria bacterium]